MKINILKKVIIVKYLGILFINKKNTKIKY